MLRRILLVAVAVVLLLGVGGYVAFQLSPWPSVLLIRHTFTQGGNEAAASQAPFTPKDVTAVMDVSYAPGDRHAKMDVFAPASAKGALPAVVWVHGGGFVAGTRSEMTGYLKMLASHGFVVAGIDYTVAPDARFPTPVRQANEALAYIVANAGRFHIDPSRIFLAGDSAGAQIAAQTALVISDPSYAQGIGLGPGLPRNALRGLVLFCGPYDPALLNFEGSYGWFMRTVIWSYVGTRDPHDPRVAQIAVAPHVTAAYPPAFISVGNADPLAPQSVGLADALRAKGVQADTLFFPKDHQPPLGHEYQLAFNTEAAHLALQRTIAFLTARAATEGGPAS